MFLKGLFLLSLALLVACTSVVPADNLIVSPIPMGAVDLSTFLDTTSLVLDHQDSILILYGKRRSLERGHLPLTRKKLDSLKENILWKGKANGFEVVIYADDLGEYQEMYINNTSQVEQGQQFSFYQPRKINFTYYFKEWPCLGWTLCIDYQERYRDNEYQELYKGNATKSP